MDYKTLNDLITAQGPTTITGGGWYSDPTSEGGGGGGAGQVDPYSYEQQVIYQGDKGYIRDPNTGVIREVYVNAPKRAFNEEAQASGYYTNAYNPDGTVTREFNSQRGNWEKTKPLVAAIAGLGTLGYGLGALGGMGASGAGAATGAGGFGLSPEAIASIFSGTEGVGAGLAGGEFAGLNPSLFAGAEGVASNAAIESILAQNAIDAGLVDAGAASAESAFSLPNEIPTPRSFNADLLPGNSSGPIDAELFGPGNSSGPIDAELFPGNSANSPIPDLPGDYPAVPEGYGTEVPGLNPGSSTIDKILSDTGKKLLSGIGSKLLGGITGGGGGGGGGGGDSGLNPGAIIGGGLAAIAGGTGSQGGAKGFDWDKIRNPAASTDLINWGKMRMVGDDPYATTPSGDYSQLARDLGVSGAGSGTPSNSFGAEPNPAATPHYTFGQPVNPADIISMFGAGKSAMGNTGGALGNLFRPPMIQTGGGNGSNPGNPDPESGNYPATPGLRGGGKVHADHPGVPVVEGRFDYRNGAAVNGPGDGQSDDIPAMLADGEYVIDAELVSMLGNGSNKAGAKVLDKFRESVRQHKRSAPLGKIPPKSKSPLAYLKEVQNG